MHDFQPGDIEDLKGFVLCKAGHRTSRTCECESQDTGRLVDFLSAFMSANLEHGQVYFTETPTGIAAHKPKSIAYQNCNEDTFREVLNRSIDFICETLGVESDDLKRMLEEKSGLKLADKEIDDADGDRQGAGGEGTSEDQLAEVAA